MIPQNDPSNLPLRDIHLPPALGWWPPALGWWLLALSVIAITAAVVFFIKKRHDYRCSAIFLAKAQLDVIRTEFYLTQDKVYLVKKLSELIRRVCVSLFERKKTASITGDDWLSFLDKHTNSHEFSQGIGRIFIHAPYQATADYDSDKLIQLVSAWMDAVGKVAQKT